MYTKPMRHTKLIHNEKMDKTIPIRMGTTLSRQITDFANKYGVSQQDAIRLAIQKGLQGLERFLSEESKNEEQENNPNNKRDGQPHSGTPRKHIRNEQDNAR